MITEPIELITVLDVSEFVNLVIIIAIKALST